MAVPSGLEVLSQDFKQTESKLEANIKMQRELGEQQTETQMVFQEFQLTEADAQIYKLIGTILIKQDVSEAKTNVKKRLEFIKTELERAQKMQKELQSELRLKAQKVEEAKKEYMEQLKK